METILLQATSHSGISLLMRIRCEEGFKPLAPVVFYHNNGSKLYLITMTRES